jgi:hypothetical protein
MFSTENYNNVIYFSKRFESVKEELVNRKNELEVIQYMKEFNIGIMKKQICKGNSFFSRQYKD